MFTLQFRTDNAAFEENAAQQVASILAYVAGKVALGVTESKIMDLNGNAIGSFQLTPEN